jgi:hypothetical protein
MYVPTLGALGSVAQQSQLPSAGEMQRIQGEAQAAPSVAFLGVCPQCSYLKNGSCILCEPGSKHPSCTDCVDGKPPGEPWWKRSEIIVPIAVAAISSATAALLTAIVLARYKKKR